MESFENTKKNIATFYKKEYGKCKSRLEREIVLAEQALNYMSAIVGYKYSLKQETEGFTSETKHLKQLGGKPEEEWLNITKNNDLKWRDYESIIALSEEFNTHYFEAVKIIMNDFNKNFSHNKKVNALAEKIQALGKNAGMIEKENNEINKNLDKTIKEFYSTF